MVPLSHIKGFGSHHGLKQIEYILEEMCSYHTECNGILTLNHKIVTDINIFVWQFEISFLVYEVTVHTILTSFTTVVLLLPLHYVQRVMHLEFSEPHTRSAVSIVVIVILVVHYCPLFFHVWLFFVFRLLKLFMPDVWFTTDTRSLCGMKPWVKVYWFF
jgi:hypothetical protein